MPYCPKCGVEVESNTCPICSHKIKQNIHKTPFSHSVEIEKRKFHLSTSEKKSVFNASTIFLALLISSICMTIDLFFDNKITWSIYPIIIWGTIALITSASIYIHKWFKVITIILILLLMLFLLDIIIPVKNFFLMISLPISTIASIISFIIVLLIKKSKRRGANVPGFIIIGLSLFITSVDMVIQNFIYGEINITWSLITSVSLLPISIFLLYIHHILSKRINLNKIFHT